VKNACLIAKRPSEALAFLRASALSPAGQSRNAEATFQQTQEEPNKNAEATAIRDTWNRHLPEARQIWYTSHHNNYYHNLCYDNDHYEGLQT
jgi:hypothetical protein